MAATISTDLIPFLSELVQNNHKEWFDKNRDRYQENRNRFINFLDELIIEMTTIDADLSNLKGKNCVFRINRDIRFSKDKSPYKNNYGGYLTKGGKNYPGGGHYIHIQPGNSFVGGGVWEPPTAILKNIRQEIDYNFNEFNQIVNSPQFKSVFSQVDGDKLVRPPKGYDESNPAIAYLKMKSFVVSKHFSDKEVMAPNFMSKVVEVFSAQKPLLDFLDRAITT